MHFILINEVEFVVNKAMVQHGVNKPLVIDVEIYTSCIESLEINIKDQCTYNFYELASELIVAEISKDVSSKGAKTKLKLVSRLYLLYYSGGFYLYRDTALNVLKKILNKHDLTLEGIGSCKDLDVKSITQLPYESDYDLFLRLLSLLKLNVYSVESKMNIISCKDIKTFNSSYSSISVNENGDIGLDYLLGDCRLYSNSYVDFEKQLYLVKEQNIVVAADGSINSYISLAKNINVDNISERSTKDVIAEGVIKREVKPHLLYDVAVTMGDIVPAKVISFAGSDADNHLLIKYMAGHRVILLCNIDTSDVYILGCISLASLNRFGPSKSFNLINYNNSCNIYSDNEKLELGVKGSIFHIKEQQDDVSLSIKSHGVEWKGFNDVSIKSGEYRVKVVDYQIKANDFIMSSQHLINIHADDINVSSNNININYEKMHVDANAIKIKSDSFVAKANNLSLYVKDANITCDNLVVNANSIVLKVGSSELSLSADKVNILSQSVSLNAPLIQFNGVVVPGTSIGSNEQSFKKIKQEYYEPEYKNKEQSLIIKDEFEELIGAQGKSIVDGMHVSIDNKKLQISDNKVTFNSEDSLSDIEIV